MPILQRPYQRGQAAPTGRGVVMRSAPARVAGVALVLAAAAAGPLFGWAWSLALGAGALLSFGHGYGRLPRRRDPEDMFERFRARSRTVERALREVAEEARPHREPWPTVDPRHPRLAEALEALREGAGPER